MSVLVIIATTIFVWLFSCAPAAAVIAIALRRIDDKSPSEVRYKGAMFLSPFWPFLVPILLGALLVDLTLSAYRMVKGK